MQFALDISVGMQTIVNKDIYLLQALQQSRQYAFAHSPIQTPSILQRVWDEGSNESISVTAEGGEINTIKVSMRIDC